MDSSSVMKNSLSVVPAPSIREGSIAMMESIRVVVGQRGLAASETALHHSANRDGATSTRPEGAGLPTHDHSRSQALPEARAAVPWAYYFFASSNHLA